MLDSLKEIFENEKIEYFSLLPYSLVRVTKERLVSREGFIPKSVIVYLLPYYTGKTENISLYSASLDYHLAIREINEKVIKKLKDLYPCNEFLGFGDHSPIDERSAALISGLGLLGDNGLLINEKYGSFVFIADIVTDLEFENYTEQKKEISFCHHCGKCKENCPTGILRGEGDSCLSAITQQKAPLTKEEELLIVNFNTVWGCDLCQTVCPYNQNPKKTPLDFFERERISRLDLKTLDSMTDEELSRRAFGWRGRKVLLRNLALFEKND